MFGDVEYRRTFSVPQTIDANNVNTESKGWRFKNVSALVRISEALADQNPLGSMGISHRF